MGYLRDFEVELWERFGFARVSVSLAALILALDRGAWNGQVFSSNDLSPYMRAVEPLADAGGSSTDREWRNSHECEDIEPTGNVRVARDAIRARLIEDVEARRLEATRLRRGADGSLDPSHTWLHLDDLAQWAAINQFELRDTWHEYREHEDAIINAALNASDQARQELRCASAIAGFSVDSDEALHSELVRLIDENKRLRCGEVIDPKRSPSRPESPSLYVIVGAMLELFLAKSPGGQRYSLFLNQAAIADALLSNHPRARGLSKRNLEQVFAAARRALNQEAG